ncbi:MAG: hypothetical protein WCP89_04585 [archaeon]
MEKSNSAKDNQEIIKTMFDDLYSLSTNICPDDLDITVEGKVLDKNRFLEIDEKLPYGKV